VTAAIRPAIRPWDKDKLTITARLGPGDIAPNKQAKVTDNQNPASNLASSG